MHNRPDRYKQRQAAALQRRGNDLKLHRSNELVLTAELKNPNTTNEEKDSINAALKIARGKVLAADKDIIILRHRLGEIRCVTYE